MQNASDFSQILSEKIQTLEHSQELKNEHHNRISGVDPAHLAFLLGQINTLKQPQTKGFRTYPQPKPRVKSTPPQPHTLNPQELLAFEFFNTIDDKMTTLCPHFSRAELKKTFRALAKKLHPDLSKQDGSAFIELKKHYEVLCKVPKK